MGLRNMSLLLDATIAASGGSPIVFADDGVTIQNGLHLIVPGDEDYQTRRQATVKFRQPTLDAKTGVYGKDKKSISFAWPLVLSSGQVVFNTYRQEREVHPLLSAADCLQMNKIAAQLAISEAVASFWANGSTY